MRILKFLLKSLLTLVILGVVTAFIGREILLFIGGRKVINSLSNLRNAYYRKDYLVKCREKGSDFIEGDSFTTAQLRFLSSTEYVTEILCGQLSLDPIIIDRSNLPPFVKKVPGSSGIIWGESRSGVTLEIFGRQKAVGVEDELIVTFATDELLGISPRSSCESFGYTCCQLELQQGAGEQFSEVTNCPKSCFSSCDSRPTILAFNSDPVMDKKTRILMINSNEKVSMSFVVDKGESENVSVQLDYGDESSDFFSSENIITEHTYLCDEQFCRYNVKLVAKDERGIFSAELPINSFTVIVKGG